MSPLFFLSLAPELCRPFPRLSLASLPPTFSFSLCFSSAVFQICGHDNQSKLNTLDNTDTETISTFRFRLYWLFSCDTGGYAISRQNNLELHLGCHTCWLSYFSLVCLWCGRTVARSVHVITKFSGMGRFTYPWCSAGERARPPLWRTLLHTIAFVLLCLIFFYCFLEQKDASHQSFRNKQKRAAVINRRYIWPATYEKGEVTKVVIPYTVKTGGWFSGLGKHDIVPITTNQLSWYTQ